MIYLDNAATSIKKPKPVAKAVYDSLLSQEYGNPSRGAYDQSLNSLRELIEIRKTISDFFGGQDPLKVVLTPNVTYALNFLIQGLFKSGDHVITSLNEHNSVLRPLYELESKGLDLSFLDLNDDFSINFDQLKYKLKSNTKGIVLTGASNVSGKVTDIETVNKFSLENDLYLIVDGAQLAGCIPFSLKNYSNIIFAFTGHKSLHGPGGTGGFIVKGDFGFSQVFSGGSGFDSFSHSQPQSLPELYEPGTMNIHSFIGLKAAIESLEELGINKIYDKLDKLTRRLYDGLSQINNIKLYTNLDKINAPIVSFNINGAESGEVSRILWDEYEIASRSGSHCAPLFHERQNTKGSGIVRLSMSYYNTEIEIDKTLAAIENIAYK